MNQQPYTVTPHDAYLVGRFVERLENVSNRLNGLADAVIPQRRFVPREELSRVLVEALQRGPATTTNITRSIGGGWTYSTVQNRLGEMRRYGILDYTPTKHNEEGLWSITE